MFDRITCNSAVLAGKPYIHGTRISVEIIVEWMESGADRGEILRRHPELISDDVEQALAYAASNHRLVADGG